MRVVVVFVVVEGEGERVVKRVRVFVCESKSKSLARWRMDALERASDETPGSDHAGWFARECDDETFTRAMGARDDDGRSALHRACARGRRGAATARAILERCGEGEQGRALWDVKALVRQTDEGDWTPLHTSASVGDAETAAALARCGAKVDARTPGGQTPGHYAASKGHLDVLEVLANAGADMTATDNVGATLLHRASGQGRLGVLDFLMERLSPTAELSKEARRALEARDNGGRTALLVACEAGQEEAAIRLARHGADVEAKDADKRGVAELAPKLVSMLKQIAAER